MDWDQTARAGAAERVHVLDVPAKSGPLCGKQATEPPYAFFRCDRIAGHQGMHTWEYLRVIEKQHEELTLLHNELREADEQTDRQVTELERLREETIEQRAELTRLRIPAGNSDGY